MTTLIPIKALGELLTRQGLVSDEEHRRVLIETAARKPTPVRELGRLFGKLSLHEKFPR